MILIAGLTLTSLVAPAKSPASSGHKHKAAAAGPGNMQHLSHGRFNEVAIYRPQGNPASVAIFLSGEGGWNRGLTDMAQMLVAKGAMVIGVDTPKLLADFDKDDGDCVFPSGDLENLSHFVQAYYRLPAYLKPVLVGYSSGGTFAYANLAQAPKDTFAGSLSLAFCPILALHKPMCKGAGIAPENRADGKGLNMLPAKSVANPWVALQGELDKACPADDVRRFVASVPNAEIVMLPKVGHGFPTPADWQGQFEAAYLKITSMQQKEQPPPPPTELGNLPVVEVPPAGSASAGAADMMAVLLSGDGGWAGLDQDVAHALAARGIPVAGVDSLRYFWTPRTPEGAAADMDRLIRFYLARWNKKRVLLLGYSQGADVLPFILNRLPQATRAAVALGGFMGLSDRALFEFHLSSWVNSQNDEGLPTMPEMRKSRATPLLCIYGEEEDDTICPKLDPNSVRIVKLSGGHHFGGDYDRLAQEILAAAHR